jgi:lipid-A-disaccharide synthase
VTRVLLSAAEASADGPAAAVATALRARLPGVELEGVGGPALRAAGVSLLERMERLSASGLVEAVGHAAIHLRLLRDLGRRIRRGRYDLVVVVDYPGFHLRLARHAAAARVPVLYYIAPQLWAWGAWRVDALRRRVRELAVILPFEEPFFARHGVRSRFVGHPLLDRPAPPSRDAARTTLGLAADAPVVALFPGSRPHEIRHHWPVLREASLLLRRAVPDAEVVVAGTPEGVYPGGGAGRIWRGAKDVLLAAADAAVTKAGTTTLEAALAGLPMVIAHRTHPLTFATARRLVRVKRIGLVNLLADGDVAPELLQGAATPVAVLEALLPLLDPEGAPARGQRAAFRRVRSVLGEPGAGARVAELAYGLVAA